MTTKSSANDIRKIEAVYILTLVRGKRMIVKPSASSCQYYNLPHARTHLQYVNPKLYVERYTVN